MKKQFFRVKQLADQTFLRADKSEVLNHEELQIADQKIEYLRTALSAIVKRIPHAGQNNDIDKRVKKCMEHHLATVFQEQSLRKNEQGDVQDSPDELFCNILRQCANAEQDLAKEYADHEKKVEDLVSGPIQALLDNEFHNILKQKRSLSKYILDKDSASNRYHATKKEALRDDMEEADLKVEQSRDVLAYEMFNLLAKENDLAGYLLQILKCQRAYHDSALKHLQDVIPQLEKQIGDSSVKRVYGISLSEHLRVTGKRIALPLEICITLLNKHGLHEEGLFRIVGGSARVKRLKSAIDSGCFSTKPIPEYQDLHVLASALKLYLRELPEPLLTSKQYNEWMMSMQFPESERVGVVKRLIANLPRENRENLAYLIQFLAELSRYPQNKMNSSNIAIVIAPNLLWDKDDTVMNMGNCAMANMLVELFIKEVQVLFPEDVSKLVTFTWLDEDFAARTTIEYVSMENVSIAESPKPNSRKKKTPAPGPPNNFSRTDQDIVSNNEKNMSYPSGSSTLNRPQKPKDNPKVKASIGINTEDVKRVEEAHKNATPLVSLDSSKTVPHKVITEPATPVQISKAKPVQPPIAQNANCDNRNFRTTATHAVNHQEQVKPVAAPRTIDPDKAVSRSSSIKIDLMARSADGDVQLRRPENLAIKPEVPVRPASLNKRPSEVNLDPSLQRTQCSVYSVANKQQPSYVNVQSRHEKYQPGHDHLIAEKERFLGHQPAPRLSLQHKFSDINSNSQAALPPKSIKIDKSDASKSNEDLGDLGEKVNGNKKPSHVRTRSDGNLIELSDSLMQTPPSPRSLNKPTQPPPPPPVVVVKKEPDSTDL